MFDTSRQADERRAYSSTGDHKPFQTGDERRTCLMKKHRKKVDTDPLARWMDQVVDQWPDRPAPVGLTAQVMSRVRAAGRQPWYRRPWHAWPVMYQRLGLAMFTLLFWGSSYQMSRWLQPDRWREPIGASESPLAQWLHLGEALALAFRAVWKVVVDMGNPYLWMLAGALGLFWISSLGLGTVVWRLARGRE